MMEDTVASHSMLLARQSESPYINMDPTRQYGYVPSISLAVVFLTVFGITTLLHLGQLIYSKRYWWMVCMVIGGVRESAFFFLALESERRNPQRTICGGGWQVWVLTRLVSFPIQWKSWAGPLDCGRIGRPSALMPMSCR
jgi:hypothetical protein